ncbi:GNAT family N-acetyltransferase [Rugamonas rubra]|uniref:Acetyltransferase (GNAT) domain-containing protein n=1 Tax=Rugamonas rubra TaxID=758825 RepID=A0A1I4LGA8_9BURK|nr:GNAT family N-acetyltransferase [Rugamonas rubra]SFL89980.1 Acetyltransferase (GNAT) domain-containing protein [Rugamonas rubra]
MVYLTEPLDKEHKQHDIAGFDCGTPALNTWLKTQASQAARKGRSITYVIVDDDNTVRGYFALVARRPYPTESLPQEFAEKFPVSVPTALLARLAVDLSVQGKGVGGMLLVEAMQRVKQLAIENGDVLLFVDAKDGQASFYTKYGFTPLLTDPQTLFIRIDELP